MGVRTHEMIIGPTVDPSYATSSSSLWEWRLFVPIYIQDKLRLNKPSNPDYGKGDLRYIDPRMKEAHMRERRRLLTQQSIV